MVNKDEKAKARREQENQNDEHAPASDIYGKVAGKDPETGVEIPTDAKYALNAEGTGTVGTFSF